MRWDRYDDKASNLVHEAVTGELLRTNDRPNHERAALLESLARARADTNTRPATGGDPDPIGYMALAIPPLDYAVITRRFPDLVSKDKEISLKAWKKFCRSPESLPYRTDASIGKRQRYDGIIVR